MSEVIEMNSELIKRKDVDESPFTVVSVEGQGHFGCMGKWRITEYLDSVNEVEEDLSKMNWNRIVQVMAIMFEAEKEGLITNKSKV
jgi:hypothetical protein